MNKMITEDKSDMVFRKLQAKPFLKWVGGKRQLVEQYRPYLPSGFKRYIEPMVGGGAIYFLLKPKDAILMDSNEELINTYIMVRDNVGELIEALSYHRNENTMDYYYTIRKLDPTTLSPVERAARFIYLNRTCYNGLYRVNRKNEFNVPFGRYKNPNILNEDVLRNTSILLSGVQLYVADFGSVTEFAQIHDFIYLDPPYQPLNPTSNFTSYTSESFTLTDQKRLADTFKSLSLRGCKVLLSNSDTPKIREMYRDYRIETMYAKRAVNSKADKRGRISELIIMNY